MSTTMRAARGTREEGRARARHGAVPSFHADSDFPHLDLKKFDNYSTNRYEIEARGTNSIQYTLTIPTFKFYINLLTSPNTKRVRAPLPSVHTLTNDDTRSTASTLHNERTNDIELEINRSGTGILPPPPSLMLSYAVTPTCNRSPKTQKEK